ncbi:hypothetical protein [Mucilaginibacter phyllosphaerae]
MKKIYISSMILVAVAITEGCIKLRIAKTYAAKNVQSQKHN